MYTGSVFAGLAQLVEQLIYTEKVRGSSPLSRTSTKQNPSAVRLGRVLHLASDGVGTRYWASEIAVLQPAKQSSKTAYFVSESLTSLSKIQAK